MPHCSLRKRPRRIFSHWICTRTANCADIPGGTIKLLVASGRAHSPRWRSLREVARIERRIRITVVLLYLAASDYVGAVVKLVESAEVARTVVNRKRRSALDGGNPGDLPPAKGLAIDTVVPPEQAVARSHRQIDYIDED